MNSLIAYFGNRPLVGNTIMVASMIFALVLWSKIGKEQMPDFSVNAVNISIRYPGASAEDVELFITKPIEQVLKGISDLEEVTSNSSYAMGSIFVSFTPTITASELPDKIQEVKDVISTIILPSQALPPIYKLWNSKEMAIIDIAFIRPGSKILTINERIELQKYALAFRDQLISLPEVSGVDVQGYLRPEYQIKVDTKKLKALDLPMSQVRSQILQQNVRTPIGSMEDKSESKITLLSELASIEEFQNVIITSGFDGQKMYLKEIADIQNGFEKTTSVFKVNQHESVVYRVKKSGSTDILKAVGKIKDFTKKYIQDNPDAPIEIVYMDDESIGVNSRLSLVLGNGFVGFILIILILFVFLDFKSGFWVAMGIPFSMSITLALCYMMGITVNNITLAAVIIVLGIVVDDAIIIAEHILTKISQGMSKKEALVKGTVEMFKPVLASTLTTCLAFVPLAMFSGRFGQFVSSIPIIVALMLFASLFECTVILPSHISNKKDSTSSRSLSFGQRRNRILATLKNKYKNILYKALHFRFLILTFFVLILVGSGVIFHKKLKYVMFPREETMDISVLVVGDKSLTKFEMANYLDKVEEVFLKTHKALVTAVYSRIGVSRRGGEVKENEANLKVEFLLPDERSVDLEDAIKGWDQSFPFFEKIKSVKIIKTRFGSESGSPIVIEIQENDDVIRKKITNDIYEYLSKDTSLESVEVEVPVTRPEFKLHLKPEEASRLGFNFTELAQTLRSYIEGDILYTLIQSDEEKDVRLTGADNNKTNIESILDLQVSNKDSYLVPLRNLVNLTPGSTPSNIQRSSFKRTTKIFADLKPDSKMTPLLIAEKLEKEVFPKIKSGSPSTKITFLGEIKESRESQNEFGFSVILVLLSIYILLVFLFDSIFTPLLIAMIIPFGVIGTILAFYFHGMSQFGFFGVIGVIGMIGIVINDSIVLLTTLQNDIIQNKEINKDNFLLKISESSSTRLRAVVVTTITTVVGLLPTAYGIGGYDPMIAEMMLAMSWGLLFATIITLILVPTLFSIYVQLKLQVRD
jgi:multidrug efflux pump subunit AcrB